MTDQTSNQPLRAEKVLEGIGEKVAKSGCLARETTHALEDDCGYIRVRINQRQEILALDISRSFLRTANSGELADRLRKTVNRAVQQTNLHLANELFHAVNFDEWNEILSIGKTGATDIYRPVRDKFHELLRELAVKTSSFASRSGAIRIVLTGGNAIQSIAIREERVTEKNKISIEQEIIETINRGIRVNQAETDTRIKDITNEMKEWRSRNHRPS
jgi:DNA-binding protein YbaB